MTTLPSQSACRLAPAADTPIRLALDLGPYRLSPAECALLERELGPVAFTTAADAAREGADVLVTERVPDSVVAWPNLKLIQLLSAGIDHLECHPIWATPIPVATASGIGHVSIAQYCLAMVLNQYHRLPQAMRFGGTGVWPDRLQLASRSLRGQTACIYGYGSIGRECARLLRPLGVNVVAVNRSGRPAPDRDYNAWPGTGDPAGDIPDAWYARDDLAAALGRSHILVVTCPASPSTRRSIDAAMLAKMPPGGLVVIVSRGSIVDERTLADALTSGHLGGAVVDTFAQEPPPPSHPLFTSPNAILTPHISGVFDGYMAKIWPLLIENVRRVRGGHRPLNLVDHHHPTGGQQ